MSATAPRALVMRAPGINCDHETVQACRLVGFSTDLLHINALLRAPERLLDYDFLAIPGGFSYGDDLGAGTLLAKNLVIHLGQQLDRFIEKGRPILGICNGFQVLVRAGLLPGGSGQGNRKGPPFRTQPPLPLHFVASTFNSATLTDNVSAQFECRWVSLSVLPGVCIFTRGIQHPIELPVAHGEGQFILADSAQLSQLHSNGQVPLVYSGGSHDPALHEGEVPYPYNPNGSVGNIAGVCNAQGNVFGLMPHPERYVHVLQHPQRRSGSDGQGDGLLIFKNAYQYVLELREKSVGARFIAPPQSNAPARTRSSLPEQAVMNQPGWGIAPPLRTYAESGVDIAAAERAKALMHTAVRATQGPQVLAGMGAFAGMFDASTVQEMKRPALVASTDGVGTKTLLAAQAGRFNTIGYDLVNHSVNDLLTQGARPLFFMDYLAMGKLDPLQAATIVSSVAAACKEVGCALLGGETAEMPDVYMPGAFDLAGTIVGIVEQDGMINSAAICPGDVMLGLPASGLHSNGYSLARRIFAPHELSTVFPELGEPLVDALLRPHRCYLREIETLRRWGGRSMRGIAHITGGGFEGNIARILPHGAQAVVETSAWRVPPLFQLLARLGNVPREEMYRTLNMGVGMVLVMSPKAAIEARCALPELLTVGQIEKGEGVIVR